MTINTRDFWKKYEGAPLKENASGGATGSGSIATVSQPLGGTIKRSSGDNLLAGVSSSAEFPNTPEHIRKQAQQWKTANKTDK